MVETLKTKEILLSTLEFQGYVKANLESIKSDMTGLKIGIDKHLLACDVKFKETDKRIDELDKEQSKIKGIWLGITGAVGIVGVWIGKLWK